VKLVRNLIIEKRAFLGSRDGGSLSIVEPGIDDCITLVHEYTDPSWTLTAWTLYAIRFEVRNFSCNLLDLKKNFLFKVSAWEVWQ
jgi:hypothetical protein